MQLSRELLWICTLLPLVNMSTGLSSDSPSSRSRRSHNGKLPQTTTRRQVLERAAASTTFVAAAAASCWGMTSQTAQAKEQMPTTGGRIQYGEEELMRQKGHGTSESPVQTNLQYGVDVKLADKIVNFNRHFAEYSGYFTTTEWENKVRQADGPLTYYDSVTGKPLFVAPVGRSKEDFLAESKVHGWPSFRDEEVVWDNVRVLRNSGETVSVDGSHLGHNLPDRKGNRYCINLVSVAGHPSASS